MHVIWWSGSPTHLLFPRASESEKLTSNMVDWMRWLWWHLEQVWWSPHCGRKGFWEVNFQWGSCRWCRWHRTPPPIINHQSHLYSFTETRELYTCCWRTDFFLLTPQLLLTFWQKWYGCVWAVLWFDLLCLCMWYCSASKVSSPISRHHFLV